MPFYVMNRWSVLYFVIFMIVTYAFLVNMLISIFYYSFKNEISIKARFYYLNKNNNIKEFMEKYAKG